MTPLYYQAEDWEAAWPEMATLWDAHWREVAVDKDIPLSVDLEAYNVLACQGVLSVLTARTPARLLVGYYLSVIRRHLHYDVVCAFTDVYYLAPHYRKGRNGLKLFAAAEAEWQRRGVAMVFAGTKLHISPRGESLDHGRIFGHLGYVNTEQLYSKRLG